MRNNTERSEVKFYLSEICSKDSLRELFIERWNWNFPKIKELYLDSPDELSHKIKSLEILAEKLQHKIILFEIQGLKNPEKELKSIERKILSFSQVKKLIDSSIFIFAIPDYEYIDFVKAEKLGSKIQIKRFSVTPENRNKLRTPSEQLENLNVFNKDKSFSSIQECIENAFSVEAVTEKFYQGYIEVFQKIKNSLNRQKVVVENKDKKLREFVHQILNRIMFLYFIQKRGCFGGNKNFLADFWDAYKAKFGGKNKFHTHWLNILFFESLSNPSWLYKEREYLGEFNEVLKHAPWLNGGLFEKNELDEIGWVIPDDLFEDIFEFFESFNFTVEESTPLDIEIAINPEMLGNIYEHLVNIEEKPEQQRAGIFYTPKAEIELMIRRALVEFLYGKTKIRKDCIYRFIFDDERNMQTLFSKDEAEKILNELDEVLILDPACGSGHYLVSAVKILYSLKERLWNYLGKEHLGKYEEKKKIIEKNIYGNDIKEWAVEIAKLRLWLELFVDAEEEKLKNSWNPLLPNFKFKVRVGDSLLQRIGSVIVPLRKVGSILFKAGKTEDLKHLIKLKKHVYESGSAEDYRHAIKLEKNILYYAATAFEDRITQDLKLKKYIQPSLRKGFSGNSGSEEKRKEEIKQMENELEELKKIRKELFHLKEPPMIWDLAFAEVFAKKNGFDIVIANPPYVRHEKIEDLTGFYSKSEYKDKLIEQIRLDWSYDYAGKIQYDPSSSTHPIPRNFPKKSDLYIYFYLKGLKLLNPNGVLCYISSNSWLDVGFGAKMQEVLLKNVPIVAIYDSVKRSFKQADINTIIALMKAPKMGRERKSVENNKVRFVMFKKPYEEIIDAEIFIELEKDNGLKTLVEGKMKTTDTYRLHTATQKELLEYGKDENGVYTGNKWGGKYLRAPDIFFTILEKGKDKLVKLGEIAEVNEGHPTGANNFFFPTKEVATKFRIERRYLMPALMKTRNKAYLKITNEHIERYFLTLPKDVNLIKGNVLKYLMYGEKYFLPHSRTLRSKECWWYIKVRPPADLIAPCGYGDRVWCSINEARAVTSNSYTEIRLRSKHFLASVFFTLNHPIGWLFLELTGRSSLGGGMLKVDPIEYRKVLVVEVEKDLFIPFNRSIESIFTELGFDPSRPIREQEPNPLPDRKALDDIVFDALGLTEEERKEVYWAVAELVKQRLEKARSV